MGSIVVTLRNVRYGEWALFAPKGHQLSIIFRGNKFDAHDWAKAWVSGFNDWTVKQEEQKYD